MSSEHNGGIEDVDPGDLTVDGDEYNFHLRIREIRTARKDARAARMHLDELGSPAAAAEYYHTAVKTYIEELEYALMEYYDDWDDDDPENYWTGYDLGDIIIDPPNELVQKLQAINPDLLNRNGIKPVNIGHIIGLREFLNTDPGHRFRHSFDVMAHVRHKGDIIVCGERDSSCSNIGASPMPVAISNNAYRAANLFLGEIGLDVPFQEDNSEAVGKYKDILEKDE